MLSSSLSLIAFLVPSLHNQVNHAQHGGEDDYGDEDDENEEGEDSQASPMKYKIASVTAARSLLSPSKSGSSPVQSVSSPGKAGDKSKEDGSQGQIKTSEDARKEL